MVAAAMIIAYKISIHSLRMEGDHIRYFYHFDSIISIHSLRMEGDSNPFTPTTQTA